MLRRGTEVSPTDPPDLPFVHDLAELVNTVRVAFKGKPGINLKREGDKHVPAMTVSVTTLIFLKSGLISPPLS